MGTPRARGSSIREPLRSTEARARTPRQLLPAPPTAQRCACADAFEPPLDFVRPRAATHRRVPRARRPRATCGPVSGGCTTLGSATSPVGAWSEAGVKPLYARHGLVLRASSRMPAARAAGPTAPSRRASSAWRTPIPSRRACSELVNSSSRHAEAVSTRCSRRSPSVAPAAVASSCAPPPPRRAVSNRKRCPNERMLICCARSLSAANAIVPGAYPTPAHIALTSWRWLYRRSAHARAA
jgi:hypothetical protein